MMINITLPDNTIKQYKQGITALEIAQTISEEFSKKVLVAKVNDELWDLTCQINQDAKIEFFTWESEVGKSVFWHSSAHLMAEAIEFFYPGTKFAIGPSIEQGFYYDIDIKDKTITSNDFEKIENKMKKLALQKNKFIRRQITKQEAEAYFKEKDDEYKLEIINELPDNEISLYINGNFTDLCKGPHLPDTSCIKALKLLNVAGAYWRGDINRPQLTRIYGISFPTHEELKEYLYLIEEAKKRDHRKIGKDLGLFTFSQNVGQGLPLWLPKGTALRERLENLLKKIQKDAGYQQVITPHIGSKQLYITSGHFEKYLSSSFQPISTPIEGEQFMLKPMNCPHHCEIYKSEIRSYRDLPIRLAEFGTVYRYEQSGELHGLTRARGFTQDDAHIFCTPDQVKQEFISVINIVLYIFNILDFKDYSAQISLRDMKNKDKYIGSEENWQKSEQAIIDAAKEKGLKTTIEYGEAVFYGPKLDFMVKDALGRKWQLGTIQIDYNLPERFELEYIGSDNQKHRPVMIHRAPFGSMERFVAILIEHTGGKFPLWLTPEQCIILTISEKFNNYGKNVCEILKNSEIRSTIDERNEKIGKKIREAELNKIPYMLIVGEKEENNKTISVRKHGYGDMGSFTIEQFICQLADEIKLPEFI